MTARTRQSPSTTLVLVALPVLSALVVAGCTTSRAGTVERGGDVELVVVMEDDSGPQVTLAPSAIRNEIGQLQANRRRQLALAKAKPIADEAIAPSTIAVGIDGAIAFSAPSRFPFTIVKTPAPRRLYVVVTRYGFRTQSAAESPLSAFVVATAQLRNAQGQVVWETKVTEEERVALPPRLSLDVTERNRAEVLASLDALEMQTIMATVIKRLVATIALQLRDAG